MIHCWKGKDEVTREATGEDYARPEDMHYTCMLPAGHAGPHEWTHDGDIIITFPPQLTKEKPDGKR